MRGAGSERLRWLHLSPARGGQPLRERCAHGLRHLHWQRRRRLPPARPRQRLRRHRVARRTPPRHNLRRLPRRLCGVRSDRCRSSAHRLPRSRSDQRLRWLQLAGRPAGLSLRHLRTRPRCLRRDRRAALRRRPRRRCAQRLRRLRPAPLDPRRLLRRLRKLVVRPGGLGPSRLRGAGGRLPVSGCLWRCSAGCRRIVRRRKLRDGGLPLRRARLLHL